MNKIVAFYSKDGNCKALAQALSEKYDCELFEIEELRPRKDGFFGFMRCGREAFFNTKSKLKEDFKDKFSSYESVILVSPVWASKTAPAINAVLNDANLKDKSVTLYACQADPNLSALKKIKPRFKQILNAKGAVYNRCYCVQGSSPGKDPFSQERFSNFLTVLLKNN